MMDFLEMDKFCGSKFWDANLTWYTDDPELTPCFEKTVLAWLPCLFLWLFSSLEVFYLLHSKHRHVPWTALNAAKFLLVLVIVGHCLADFGFATVANANHLRVHSVDFYSPAIKFVSFCLLGALVWANRRRGQRSSGLVFLFFLFSLVLAVAQTRTILRHYVKYDALPDPQFTSISFLVYHVAVLLSFVLNFFADPPPKFSEYPAVERPCPESAASFASKLAFSWFSPLAWLGYRTPLEAHHLWHMNPEDTAAEVVPQFDKHWDALVAKTANEPSAKASYLKRSGSVDFVGSDGGGGGGGPKGGAGGGHASILMPLCKAFGPTFLFGAFLKFIQDLLTFVSPQLLKLLIAFVSGHESMWKGYMYAFLLVAVATCQTLLLAQYFYRMSLVGLRIRTALISAIYRKAMRISNSARKESTVGEVVNLMSVDAQRFMDLTNYLNMIWSAPLQIALSIYFLYQTLGPSVFAGLAVMIILIPVNGWVANKVKNLQIKQMKNKDERVKLMNEILSGIKVLKLYAWEPSFEQQVLRIREKEMKVLKQAAYLNAATSFIWACAPFLVSLASFTTYVLSDENNILDAETAFVSLTLFNLMRFPMALFPMFMTGIIEVSLVTFAVFVMSDDRNILDSETAFVALSLFNILRFPLSMLPMLISNMVQTGVSIKRINKFMNSEELDPHCVQHDQFESDPVVVENGTFSWGAVGGSGSEEAVVLRGVTVRVKQSRLVAVVGTVGSGKSSLLSAILGEMDKISGRVNTKGSVAYVPQQAWIQNATLKDNILFGRGHDASNYSRVVRACALTQDFDMLPAGDMTEIGEKGINLSGGQKQRVSLARAVYSDSDVYLLDDPLSAVDSHVGKHIFDNVIGPKGLLKKKTRVLVTHALTYLPETDLIVVLKDGRVSESGTYKELLAQRGAFADFIVQYLTEAGDDQDVEMPEEVTQLIESDGLRQRVARQRSRDSESSAHSLQRQRSSSESVSESKQPIQTNGKSKPGDRLIEAEKTETGSVKRQVYVHYMKSIGAALVAATISLNVLFQVFSIGSNVWLSRWSSDQSVVVNGTQDADKRTLYLGVYAALGLGQGATQLFGTLSHYLGSLRAAAWLQAMMLGHVLRSPTSFFDTTPVGRVLNRFAKDVDTADTTLPVVTRSLLFCLFSVIATLTVISYTTPIFVIIILPIGFVYFFVQRFYVATSRQLKRLESVSRSPIYSHFGESVTGAVSIRAYGVQRRFIAESEEKVDFNQVCLYPSLISNRWLAVRLETVGNLIIFFSALFAVLNRDTTNAGLVGLSVSYALQITQTLNWLVRMTSDVETNIVAVERIKEYGETPQEAAWEVSPGPAASWPEHGEVAFDNYQVRYREGLDLVLKGVSFTVNGGEKVGIVGRTGAGKSSLTLCLFRILEAAAGRITIDGHDIAKLGLHDLRSRLTIIPQDPVLFSGTLRMNLDPFGRASDDSVWRALELAHLKAFVRSLTAGLQHQVTEGGDNLSVGQRQLICLARAVLRKTKVLVLDEATAAVDLETDDLIQRTIRAQFADCTVLTIAHRLNTIMDSDRVIVLDKGHIKEFDTPANLLKNKSSIFYGMAKDANLV